MTLALSKKEIMNEARSAMTINVGKAGVNDNVIEEIKRQLKANQIVKLRFARSVAKDKDDLIRIDNIYKTNNMVNVEIDVDPIRL